MGGGGVPGRPIALFKCRSGQASIPSLTAELRAVGSVVKLSSTDERRVQLQESLRIGRAVAQLKPSQGNLIFECKVLSRTHALLSYEKGRVRLLLLCISYVISYVGIGEWKGNTPLRHPPPPPPLGGFAPLGPPN